MLFWIHVLLLSSTLVIGADVNYRRKTINDHFSQSRHHEVNNNYKIQAKEFIFSEFQKFGLQTEYQTFDYPPISNQTKFTNVIGVLKGARFGTESDRIIGVVAHYDTVKASPGVDDNGAGVAAMLEVARQIGNQYKNGIQLDNTVIFVAPDLGEYVSTGTLLFLRYWFGSGFANTQYDSWLAKNYGFAGYDLKPYGAIVLDSVMEFKTTENSQQFPNEILTQFPQASNLSRGDFLAMIYRSIPDAELEQSLSQSWSEENREQFKLEPFPLSDIRGLDQNATGNFLKSDHFIYWGDNLPAVFLTDSANYRGEMIRCYHQQCDNFDTMLTDDNLNFLAKTADAIFRTINQLSDPKRVTSTTAIPGDISNSNSGALNFRMCSTLYLLMFLVVMKKVL